MNDAMPLRRPLPVVPTSVEATNPVPPVTEVANQVVDDAAPPSYQFPAINEPPPLVSPQSVELTRPVQPVAAVLNLMVDDAAPPPPSKGIIGTILGGFVRVIKNNNESCGSGGGTGRKVNTPTSTCV